jgi:hypothetical protein
LSKLGTQSEIDKLGETLALDPDQLAFLSELPPEELRSLRVSVYERMFELDRVLFERLAMLGARLPAAATARVAERLFGPIISARVVAEMPTAPALAVAERVSPAFFADAAPYLDPRRLRDMIPRLPVERAVEVARELVSRGQFMTVSRFVDFVTDEQTRAVVDAIDDEAAILRVAFYMGSKNRMDHLFRTLAPERIERMVRRVEQQPDELLPAFLSVLIHVSYALRRELGEIIAAQPPGVLAGYVRATHRQQLWPDVLPVLAGMADDAARAIVNLPVLAEPPVQRSIIDAADDHALWGLVLPLVAMMDERGRAAVAAIVASMGPDTLKRCSAAALMGEHWDTLLALAALMPAAKQSELARIVGELGAVDPELLARISSRAEALGVAHFTSESRTGVSTSSAYS